MVVYFTLTFLFGDFMDLVQVKGGAVYCDSSMIAKKFKVKHAYVIRNCNSLIYDIKRIKGDPESPLILTEEREYRGNKYTAYLMSREMFSLLAMRFKGSEALEWQIKFNSAFYDMEKALYSSVPTMETLNDLVRRAESDKQIASDCASQLARYKKLKRENKQATDEAFEKIQLSLGFGGME